MSLPVTAEPLPSTYTFGKVVGRVIHLIADTAEDTDDKPQARAAAGRVIFAPKEVLRKTAGPDYPAIVLHATEFANLSSSGRVLDAEGRQGIWLAVGIYTVTFEITGAARAIPSFDIEVTTAHTDETPLDLATLVPYVAPVGTVVQTVVIPSGGTTGQVLVRAANGSLEWANQTGGSGGTATTDASLLTSGILPAARIADGSITAAKVAADVATQAELDAASTADRARANHTGTQSLDTTTDSATRLAMTAAERTKLAGVATSATANATDAQLRDRSTHTGTQTAATISDFAETARDTLAAALVAGTNVTITPNDGADTITIAATGGGGGAGLPATVVTRTTAYTAAAGDFVLADATSAGFTVTLPAAPTTGALVTVKKIDATANVVTVVGQSATTIDGDANATVITKGAGAVFEYDGTNWRITAVTSAQGPKGDTGPQGPQGIQGIQGTAGTNGQGVPVGGTTGQILAKTSNTDYATGWIAAPTGGGSVAVQDEGSALTARATINFVGAGVTATDDAANSRTLVTIPGGGGSSAVYGMGRPGFYFATPGQIATQTMDVGVMRATPIFLGQATPIDRIGVNVTSAASTGGVIRIGVYADSGNMSPGARLFDLGTIDATTTGAKELTVAQTLPAGFCWLVAVAQVAQSIIGANSNVPYVMSHSIAGILENQIPGFASSASTTTGALPTPFGTFNGQVTTPRIVCRAA